MAVQWNWRDKMGKITVRQGDNRFTLNIYRGNCLAVFLYEYQENNEERYMMYNFWLDRKHCDNIVKDMGSLFSKSDKVSGIELNLWYPSAQTILDIFVKNGYSVKCYYKEPKQPKK